MEVLPSRTRVQQLGGETQAYIALRLDESSPDFEKRKKKKEEREESDRRKKKEKKGERQIRKMKEQ